MTDCRLKNYIISSHVDKTLDGKFPDSVYDCYIQAGAALTSERVCTLNDHDGFAESISEKNSRYSEATAMWWIYKHLDTPYVGLTHYRRRLRLTDIELSDLMDQSVDIITSKPIELTNTIEAVSKDTLYVADWNLSMEILKEHAPEDYNFAQECYSKRFTHPSNVHIFRQELYQSYCEWAFPMLEAFCRRSPEKTDIYQHRDVGFIAERLSHLFVMKVIRDGGKVVEAELVQMNSPGGGWHPEQVCDLDKPEEVFLACDRLYRERQIGRCGALLGMALERGCAEDARLRTLERILVAANLERKCFAMTMHEYLPFELRSDLNRLMETYEGFGKAIHLYLSKGDELSLQCLAGYIKLTHFSQVVATRICVEDDEESSVIENLLRLGVWE